ncbi:MAG: sulfatase-like hydrolase/transferase, partial [Actinomycetota bacterium]|nr:sulfatase-like hydrolase/transferase [Actinomycetota bacterium]
MSFLRTLLSRRDWVYLLSLLVPFVVYNLILKADSVLSQPREPEPARVLDLMSSDVFFNLGYALLWIGLFVATRGSRSLRRAVVVLFHASTMFVAIVTTCAHQYFRQNGTTLDYSTIAEWIPKFREITPILFQGGVPLWAWIVLAAALLYATLGPWFVTRVVARLRRARRSPVRTAGASFLSTAGLWFLALGFGMLSLVVGTTTLTRDPFLNVVLTGFEESIDKQDNAYSGQAIEHPAAHTTLAQTSQTEKRNVALIHLESTRAQSVTPYNEGLKTTPFLDELAEQSLLAERAYVVVPRSSKASVVVNCGVEPPLYQGPEFEPGSVPARCLADLLRDQGYHTVFFQSSSETMDNYGAVFNNFGYEEYYPSEAMDKEGFEATNYFGYEDDIMLKPSERWLREHTDN